MEIKNFKNDKTMNQIFRLSNKGLIVLQKLYIDLTIEQIYKNNNLDKALESLEIIKIINKEMNRKFEKR